MGTNYFVKPPGATSDDPDDWIHLGKSSAGWAFTFRAYPESAVASEEVTWPVNDYASWYRLLSLGAIFDEYGKPWTAEELLVKIEGKRGGHSELYGDAFYDEAGNAFYPGEFS